MLLIEFLLLAPVDDGVDLMDEDAFELLKPVFLIELVLRVVFYYSAVLALPVQVAFVELMPCVEAAVAEQHSFVWAGFVCSVVDDDKSEKDEDEG